MKLKVVGPNLGILLELPSHFFPECHQSRVTTSLHGNKGSRASLGRGQGEEGFLRQWAHLGVTNMDRDQPLSIFKTTEATP